MREFLHSGTFFWLDVHKPEASDLEILREEFGFHPLALEDSWVFNERPKIDDYDGYVFLVVFGASDDADADGVVEVHCLLLGGLPDHTAPGRRAFADGAPRAVPQARRVRK